MLLMRMLNQMNKSLHTEILDTYDLDVLSRAANYPSNVDVVESESDV